MPLSYAEPNTSTALPFLSSPQFSRFGVIDGSKAIDDDDQIQYNAGRSFRPRRSLTQSIKAAESGDSKSVGFFGSFVL